MSGSRPEPPSGPDMGLDRAAGPFVVGFGLLAGLAFLWNPWAAAPFAALTLFSLWFFRDPRRSPPISRR